MGVMVKKKDQIQTGVMFIRGITNENIKFFKAEVVRLGYASMGEYMNELARTLRQEIIDAGGDPVRYKRRQASKKTK